MGRTLPVLNAPAAQGPESEGWTRRFIAVGDRLIEAKRLYQELGFDVRLERPVAEELREECGDCHIMLQQFLIVYTRRPL